MPSSLVYSESTDLALELVTLGSKLGTEVFVAVLGTGDLSQQTQKISVQNVSKIFKVSHESLKDTLSDPVVDALEAVYNQAKPDVVLIGATKRGKDFAPRLATRVKASCISDALRTEISSGSVIADRLVWGGNAIATVASKGVAVVAVPPRAYERTQGSSQPSVESVSFQPRQGKVKLIGRNEKPKGQVNIKDADVVVSAGRGFKKKDDLSLLDELASVLNGVVGASRPLTSDLGWMPEERQVGLSGNTVKPKLYIAVGISGQIQHLTGMRDSKIIVAINSDKHAPIFQECDYGVVGDLYAVVPELTKVLKTQLGR